MGSIIFGLFTVHLLGWFDRKKK